MSVEMEEKVDLHNSVDEEDVTNCVEVVEVESSEFSTSVVVGSSEEAFDISDSDFEFHVSSAPKDSSTDRIFEELPPEWYIPPDPAKLVVGKLNLEELECLHSRWIASYRLCVDSHDDVHKCSISNLCTSTQDYQDYALTDYQDSRFKIKKPDYSHLLGHDLRAELIKQGFLSPLSGSVQSIISEPSHEIEENDGSSDDIVTSSVDPISVRTEEIDGSSDDKVTSSVDTISSRTTDVMFHNELQSRLLDISFLNSDSDTDSIPDMPECRNNPKQSPVCDAIDIVAKSNKDNAEIVQDNEWERLDDEDSSDEDWEIV